MNSSSAAASVPAATKATAQSRTPAISTSTRNEAPQPNFLGERYTLGPGVCRAASITAYERRSDDPVYRPLKVYALDPAAHKVEGATAVIAVPYEPLEAGPKGAVFEVVAPDGGEVIHLDDPKVLLGQGLDASPSNRLFHQQMAYAVCSSTYAVFRSALGRRIAWGFDRPDAEGHTRLRIRPHASQEGANAAYDRNAGEIRFGCFPLPAGPPRGRNVPGGPVYTCLSHDIVVHELTHALIDGIRSHFLTPTGGDVLAFHEGFADVVAVLQHFSFRQLLESEIRKTRNDLAKASLLPALAQAFGMALGQVTLRSAVDPDGERRVYRQDAEPHELGNVLLAAVYDAFCVLYRRKTERYTSLCAEGPGGIAAGLVGILADQASKLAGQLLALCVRALDYCPPVDITLGEFLRAMITADRDLVPDDPWAYRETLIDAFAARGIYPEDVEHLSEDALVWRPLPCSVDAVERLSFAQLRFAGDPASPASAGELREQACALGDIVTRPDLITLFGLAASYDSRLDGGAIELPVVQSIRTARRVGPDGQIVFDLVAEVTQTRYVRDPITGAEVEFAGGCTIILGPAGEFRYVILKSVLNRKRLERQMEYQRMTAFCERRGSRLQAIADPLRLLHRGRTTGTARRD